MPKTADLVDNFSSEDTDLWSGWSSDVEVTDGQLGLTYTTSAPTLETSDNDWDLTDSHIFVEVVYHEEAESYETYLTFGDVSDPFGGDQLQIHASWSTIFFTEMIDGSGDSTSMTFDATDMRWWRIRHKIGGLLEDDTIFWDTSPDGADWTNQRTKTAGFTPDVGRVRLVAYNFEEDTTEQALLDNVNGGQSAGEVTKIRPLTYNMNRLAGTDGLAAQGAANVWAGTDGLSLVGALNVKNGTTGLALQGVLNALAGTEGLGVDAASSEITE